MFRNKIIISILLFLLSFSFLFIIRGTLIDSSKHYLKFLENKVFEQFSEERGETKKGVLILDNSEKYIEFKTYIVSLDDGLKQKDVKINVFTQFVLPLILIISFSLSIPLSLKNKLLLAMISSIFGFLIMSLKILIIALDNYKYPDIQLIELVFPLEQIVWSVNKFISVTGSSSNFIIPIIIVLVCSIPFYRGIIGNIE